MVKIESVRKGSYADRAGIAAGDELIGVNGNTIHDVLDYRFHICNEKLDILLQRDGKEYHAKIKKDEYDDIGLEFETFLMDCKHSCRNKCIFCFIDQLPKGMRDTLYFKDDDSRLSFLQGNYITMTNLSDEDVDRIIKMRMSPINISVHTKNKQLRIFMLKNKNAGKCLSYLKRFYDAGIEMSCQIVLCRGVNDGDELIRTMHDLAALHPYVESVSIVPAGMTKFREGLAELTPFSKEEAAGVIATVEWFAGECKKAYGTSIFYCADEMYIEAGLPLPDGEYYEGYRQIENGVGMISSMRDEFHEALSDFEPENTAVRTVAIATGAAAYDFICSLARELEEKFPFIKINVYKIDNNFFGTSITVAGLITGVDLSEQLADKELGARLYLPCNMLRHERDLFLCGMSVDELSEKLGVPIEITENDGYDFVEKIMNI